MKAAGLLKMAMKKPETELLANKAMAKKLLRYRCTKQAARRRRKVELLSSPLDPLQAAETLEKLKASGLDTKASSPAIAPTCSLQQAQVLQAFQQAETKLGPIHV